jgi:hypothetical protein
MKYKKKLDKPIPEEYLGRYEEILTAFRRFVEVKELLEKAEEAGDETLMLSLLEEFKALKAIIFKKGLTKEELKMEKFLIFKAKF